MRARDERVTDTQLEHANQLAPHTARTYRSTLRSFALYVQSELGLPATTDALALSTVLDYKRHLQAPDPATRRPRAQTATIAKQLSALRGFARWLALDDELARVDARIQLVKASRGDPPLPRALTANELRRVLAMPDRATTRGTRDLAILELLAHAGLRRAEAAALRCAGSTSSRCTAGPTLTRAAPSPPCRLRRRAGRSASNTQSADAHAPSRWRPACCER
ncbi:MAG: integrase/recombinase XerD [Solirubrobacteraceae bacterium]|nr:integrase/recombinase XerD [Solirubrobacteraceae bacterium]